ncbi:MAG: hypothetical protein NW223_11625 [Hyphomicrobiaceae bacterium]|nr:hypothetical protein [Hyphomicrobiaceae bacterium]
MAHPRSYRQLDAEQVIKTVAKLQRRISERFPNAGLANVCADLQALAQENSARARRIARSNIPLRASVLLLLVLGVAALTVVVSLLRAVPASADSIYSVLQGIEAAANLTVLVGAGLFFLFRSEERMKRQRALTALHELRSIIHVIDMHQLTKDPSATASISGATTSSPARLLTPYELTRYLDYCSEMLSLTSKLAVLFAQSFPDPIVTDAVSDIERIASNLSQKIWQKIMIVGALNPSEPVVLTAAGAIPAAGAAAAAAAASPAPTSLPAAG